MIRSNIFSTYGSILISLPIEFYSKQDKASPVKKINNILVKVILREILYFQGFFFQSKLNSILFFYILIIIILLLFVISLCSDILLHPLSLDQHWTQLNTFSVGVLVGQYMQASEQRNICQNRTMEFKRIYCFTYKIKVPKFIRSENFGVLVLKNHMDNP